MLQLLKKVPGRFCYTFNVSRVGNFKFFPPVPFFVVKMLPFGIISKRNSDKCDTISHKRWLPMRGWWLRAPERLLYSRHDYHPVSCSTSEIIPRIIASLAFWNRQITSTPREHRWEKSLHLNSKKVPSTVHDLCILHRADAAIRTSSCARSSNKFVHLVQFVWPGWAICTQSMLNRRHLCRLFALRSYLLTDVRWQKRSRRVWGHVFLAVFPENLREKRRICTWRKFRHDMSPTSTYPYFSTVEWRHLNVSVERQGRTIFKLHSQNFKVIIFQVFKQAASRPHFHN